MEKLYLSGIDKQGISNIYNELVKIEFPEISEENLFELHSKLIEWDSFIAGNINSLMHKKKIELFQSRNINLEKLIDLEKSSSNSSQLKALVDYYEKLCELTDRVMSLCKIV